MQNVIVSNSYGVCSVYWGTVENAKKILDCHRENIDKQVINMVSNKSSFLVKESILNVVNKMLQQDVDTMASKTIKVTKGAKQETVLYCFEKKIEIKNNKVDSYNFFKDFKVEDLSYFANNENYPKDSILVDEYVAEQARTYRVIKNDSWKEGATEKAKVNYIINFCNEIVDSSDTKYELVSLEETF